MRRQNYTRHALCLAVMGAIATGPVYAQGQQEQDVTPQQQSAQAPVTSVGKVKVSARKRDETLQEVPVAVTAFTPETIQTLNVQDLSDLDAQVPNLTVYAARGSNTTLTAYIRGVGQSDPLWGVDPGVGLYLDDVYIARPQGALLDVFDVERLEVLRGPQGTLYGKNTIGGAIKYISKELPVKKDGFVSLTVGNHNQLDGKAAIGGAIGNDMVRGRISVANLTRDGFGESVDTGEHVTDKHVKAVRAELGFFPSDVFNIKFAYDWMKDRSGVRGAKMLAPNKFAPGFAPMDSRYDVRNGMPNINDTDMQGLSATATWNISPSFTAKYVVAKRESDTETNIDFDTLPNKIADVKAFYSDSQLSNELQLNYDGGGMARGVVGLYHFDGDAGGQVLNNFFNFLFGDTQGVVNTKAWSIYTDWIVDFSDRFSMNLGARYTDETKHADVLNRGYADAAFTIPTTIAADFNKKINFTNVSPKISLNYDLTDDVMVYGTASRGFKSGGYNIRAQATAVPRSAEPFNDEQVDSFEVGSKMSFLNDTMFLNLAAFHNKYKDIQLSVFTAYDSNGDGTDDAFFGDFTNAGKGTVNGAELEWQWLPNKQFVFSGNLAWLDAKYDEFLYAGLDIADEQEFTNAPKFSGALNAEYRIPLAVGELALRGTYSYQDDVIATTEIVRTGAVPIKQEGYGLVSAGAIWRSGGPWSVSLQGTNLADKEYMTTGYNLNSALGVYTGFFGAPRQYSLTVRYDF